MSQHPLSDNVVLHSWDYKIVCKHAYYSQDIKELLKNPDQGMQGAMLKIDREKIDTTTVALTEINHQCVVIKRYNIKNLKHGLKRSMTSSRASRCWRNAHRLINYGIATPEPIAMVESRMGPFRKHAYYIYKYQEGVLASELFQDENIRSPEIIEQAKNFVAALKKMFSNKIAHGDMKSTNFLFHQGQPYFIDLDGMKQIHSPKKLTREKHKDLKRFLKNWDDKPKVRELFEELFRAL